MAESGHVEDWKGEVCCLWELTEYRDLKVKGDLKKCSKGWSATDRGGQLTNWWLARKLIPRGLIPD